MDPTLLDFVPMWCVPLAALTISVLSVEAGFRYGRRRSQLAQGERSTSVSTIVGAMLGLLAFMLAFTFGLADNRFEARRTSVLNEANALGTAWLRIRLLPDSVQPEMSQLLRQYTDLRVNHLNPNNMGPFLKETEQLQGLLWAQAEAAAEIDRSPVTSLFLQSLNEVIDLHSTRVYYAFYCRIPTAIWLTLLVLTVLGLSAVGYHSGLTSSCRSPEMLILGIAFSGVLTLIIDLDRGHEGLLRVNQTSLRDVYRQMQQ